MQCPDDWYQHFFYGVALDLWRTVTTSEMTNMEADTIVNLLSVAPAARILDVPCGNGRITLELMRRGYATVGVDLSTEFITEAKQKAEKENVAAEFLHRDMRNLDGLGTFDAAICWGNSFGYLPEEGTIEFLRGLARVVKPGGKVLLDFGTLAECILPELKPKPWYQIGDMLLMIENEYDISEGRLISRLTFVKDGKQEARMTSQQVWLYRDLRKRLQEVGFNNVELRSWPRGELFEMGKQRAIVVATRQ